ncbi:hypothetical protein ACFFMR_00075 [Micromonospora andamanensis]|uniref:Uncharacterized protein n=1 Tax=Micromonospora andamanensis TaxID=1287068 RepID=A0ABQ4I2A8_9ACTN|nr:hypothetical protein [Micromonospora andamanensis]GIJ12040.1 hypothetical protein Van01_52540 [Micromonospora andamanensis]GIJ40258.1 hypothetical protein Vwe01_35830 [Micromonospora andamanensis]
MAEMVVRPRDVLLMRFRPTLMDDLLAVSTANNRAGLRPVLLKDYVQ